MSQFISFGNGHDGAVSAATGTINTYAAVTGSANGTSVTTALSVAAGDVVLLHQTYGTGATAWELVRVATTGSGVFTADRPLVNTFGTGAQAVLVPQYVGGTNSNTITCTAWDGTVGGIIAFLCNSPLTITGTITTAGQGSRGGQPGAYNAGDNQVQLRGDGTTGNLTVGAKSGTAGSGGYNGAFGVNDGTGGGGGGNGAAGTNGVNGGWGTPNPNTAYGGDAGGAAALTSVAFGGGGGEGGGYNSNAGGAGGDGGGFIFIAAKTITTSSATISCNGANGSDGTNPNGGGGGGGAGGSVLIKAQTATLGTNKITVAAGGAGTGYNPCGAGGAGAVGRIHLDYALSYTGSTTPEINVTQTKTLLQSGFIPFL